MKIFFKRLGLGLLGLLVITISFAAHEWYAEKPVFFRAFLDRSVIKIALERPETLTSLGFLESIGINGHNANLNDNSPEKIDELYATARQVHETLLTYDNLDEKQQLSKDIALYLLDAIVANEDYRRHNYPVNQLFGIQNGFPTFMDASHRVNSVEDAEHYISRLNKVEIKFAQSLEGLKIREQNKIIPPKFVIQRVLDEMQGFVSTPAEENILYTSLAEKIDKAENFPEAQKQQLLEQAHQAIVTATYPAYQLFIDYFTELETKAVTDDGFWHLPGGDIAYQQALKFFTTTDYSAEYIHQTGLDEVARIQSEILAVLASEGFDTAPGFTVAIEELAAQERFYYPDTDEGRQQILSDYQSILDEIEVGLDQAFNLRPKAGMEVKRIPVFKEKTSPGAYYQRPSLDGSRPGAFFANLYDIKATPSYSMRTLAYHEGIPGHHFQVAIAMELKGLPFFRNVLAFCCLR